MTVNFLRTLLNELLSGYLLSSRWDHFYVCSSFVFFICFIAVCVLFEFTMFENSPSAQEICLPVPDVKNHGLYFWENSPFLWRERESDSRQRWNQSWFLTTRGVATGRGVTSSLLLKIPFFWTSKQEKWEKSALFQHCNGWMHMNGDITSPAFEV